MISDILGPWRRFWGLPWTWKGPIFGVAAAVVVAIGIVMASGGGDDGPGSAAGAKFAQTSPKASPSRSPSATTSPSVSPTDESSTPAPEATEPPLEPEASPPPEGVVTPPPEPPTSEGPPLPLLPHPSPAPTPPPGTSPDDLATLAQFDYCSDAWWRGVVLELQLGLMSKLSGTYDVSQFQQELQNVTDYLNQNCVGIGARAGAIPGIGAVRCNSVRQSSTILKMWGTIAQSLGGGTNSLQFATTELQAFEAAAGCPSST